MQQSLLISTFGHGSVLLFMMFYGWEVNNRIDPLPTPVQVSVVSISEFDAKLSVAPDSIIKKLSVDVKNNEVLIKSPEFQINNSELGTVADLEKITLERNDESFASETEVTSLEIKENNLISLQAPEKIKLQEIYVKNEQVGNERNSFETPKITKPISRTADRIDKIAVTKSNSERVVEISRKAVKVADDGLEVKEISDAQAPKEASTQIIPEGKKNVPILVSGAVQKSSPPPFRPKIAKKVNEPPKKRPKASELLKTNKQSDQIEMLLAQVENDQVEIVPEVSIIEKNNMMSAIAQKLAKYWEQGILAGNSNFEKYIVQVQVEVNSLGEIIGAVKPLVPRDPKGRYLIAYRQASNALISAAILPIIPGKYPSGITFEITFDPEEGFSF